MRHLNKLIVLAAFVLLATSAWGETLRIFGDGTGTVQPKTSDPIRAYQDAFMEGWNSVGPPAGVFEACQAQRLEKLERVVDRMERYVRDEDPWRYNRAKAEFDRLQGFDVLFTYRSACSYRE